MGVPGMVVGVGDFGPDDLDDASAGFDETTGEEAAVAKGVFAIGLAGLLGFLFESEGFTGAAADDEVERSFVIFLERVFFDGFIDGWHLRIDGIAKSSATFKAKRKDVGTQLQIVDLDARHLVHVHVVAAGIEGVGVV